MRVLPRLMLFSFLGACFDSFYIDFLGNIQIISLLLFNILTIMIVPQLNLDIEGNDPVVFSENVNDTELKNELNNYRPDKPFSILNYNIRSCRRNFSMFYACISHFLFNFSLIVLTESWLNLDTDHGFQIPQYKQLNLYCNSVGGGIKVYFLDFFNGQIIENFTYVSNIMEVLTFWLTCNTFKYLICCIYRLSIS